MWEENFSLLTEHAGQTVDQWIRSKEHHHPRGRVSRAEKLRLVRPIAETLHALHAHGLVHNDIKCDNVCVKFEVDGTPKVTLIDFGHALEIGAQFQGRQSFRAPELQQRGGAQVSPITEVFSLAILIYDLGIEGLMSKEFGDWFLAAL